VAMLQEVARSYVLIALYLRRVAFIAIVLLFIWVYCRSFNIGGFLRVVCDCVR
jgi:hypothetical protein